MDFKWYLKQPNILEGYTPIRTARLERAERRDIVDLMVNTYNLHGALKCLRRAEMLENLHRRKNFSPVPVSFKQTSVNFKGSPSGVCQRKLKSNLKKKYQCVFEGIAKAGNPTLLKQIYTELYITEGGTAEVNDEHEVRQIETASRKADRPETTIRCEDMFKASPGRDEPIRTVVTKGVAGIGKTVLTQKFTLDWAEDKANQDIQFMFPFTFRELNVLREKKFSLVELVHHFFTETKEAGICRFEDFQVVFIFDGLDECRLPLDFHNTETLTDVRESTSVDVLLTNLIRGKLLPSARLWITTRPAAANQIPPDCVDMREAVKLCPQFSAPKSSSLKDLDLSNNNLQDSGVTLLFCWTGESTLYTGKSQLSGCLITEEGCASLASALNSNPSHLRELGPELQSSRRVRSEAAVCWTGGSTLETGHTQGGACWRPMVKSRSEKYSCELAVDTDTVNGKIKLSDDRKIANVIEVQSYPDHPDRFDYFPQLLCRTGLTGRCYWEVEWRGDVSI
ncbi:NLR family CARD domain-containing protein 3, partial [Nibea albiflora]